MWCRRQRGTVLKRSWRLHKSKQLRAAARGASRVLCRPPRRADLESAQLGDSSGAFDALLFAQSDARSQSPFKESKTRQRTQFVPTRRPRTATLPPTDESTTPRTDLLAVAAR